MAIVRDIMPAFELFQPATIGDALGIQDRYGKDGWVMAGGLDTFDWLKDRIKRPKAVIDLSQIKELSGVRQIDGGGIEIGAIAPDDARLFQRLSAPDDLRFRQPHLLG